jgi:carbon storage regulator
MLVISRHRNESIMIGDDVTITIVDIRGDVVRLGVEAPKEVPVHRREVFDAIHRNELQPEPELTPESDEEALDLHIQINHLKDQLANAQLENARLKDRNILLTETAEREIVVQQKTLDQLRQEIARLQTDRANIIHDHDHEICSLQTLNAQLQDEINDLLDCKEHLRQIGQEICGCEHVESPDERAQQTHHIIEAFKELGEHQEKAVVLALCTKHSIISTTSRGCYICQAEKE